MIQERKITLEVSDVQEALNEASRQWKLPVEDLHAEILSTERDGFLGLFGSRKIRVEVTADARQDIMSRGMEFVDAVLRLMDFDAHSAMSETERNMIDIQGEDAADYVVGRYGDALKGMEYIVNLALRDPKTEPRIKIDSCGYRERRTKSLERLAEATARQAVKYGRPVRLDPMASWERWVIHTTLKSRNDVTTESVGETPNRKVVVIPKFEPEEVRMPGPATMRVRAQRERTERLNARNAPPSRSYPPRRRSRRDRPRRDDTGSTEQE
ncbi:MAG: Jag N-terminal domain-containing protein [Synergistaceae bacterium]|nr:Jag N-terminal domain-containing protein [Synergistaceae bacterium]